MRPTLGSLWTPLDMRKVRAGVVHSTNKLKLTTETSDWSATTTTSLIRRLKGGMQISELKYKNCICITL